MTSLYELDNRYKKLVYKDELTDDDLAEIDNLGGLIEDKIVAYACVINEFKDKLDASERAMQMVCDKQERIGNTIEKLEKRVADYLVNNGITKIDKHPIFDVKLQKNRTSVDVYNRDQVPAEYWKTNEVMVLDKGKIKEDIENLGLVIPGAKLINKLVLKIG